ncbi:hypothetical protein WN990_36840 [Kitasatospora purpeofusca]|uniref:hypothetical protein n=1 Tax=Kitasatospora purpeofusca TaxID=67352 RepID=UPI0030F1F07E
MDDPERCVEALFDAEAETPADVARLWTPALHRSVMERLRAAPGPGTRVVHEYVSAVHRTPGTYRSGRRRELRNDRAVLEAVDHWVLRGPDGVDAEQAASILEHGIASAVRRYERERASTWYALWRGHRRGRPLRRHRGFHTFMEGGVDDCPDCVRDMDRLADGGFEREAAEEVAAGRPAAEWTERAVRLVAWVTAQRHPHFRLFTRRDTGHVWYLDLFGTGVLVFDGRSVSPAPMPFTLEPADDRAFVAGATRCEQRSVAFSGKHSYRAALRYGRQVLLVAGTHHASRGGAEMDYSLWLSPGTAEAAAGLIEDFTASLPRSYRRVPAWSDAKRGSLMRRYSGEPALGVWGRHWAEGIQGARPEREFADEPAAIAALEAQELDWIRAGKVLTNLYLRMPAPSRVTEAPGPPGSGSPT